MAELASTIGHAPCSLPGDVPAPRSAAVGRGLVGIVVARLAVNGGIRVVYPFVTVIAAGLGMSVESLALLVASRALAGLAGPAVARLVSPDRRRSLMLASQLLVITGCVVIVASSGAPASIRVALAGVGFIATGLARPLFDLPMQTWVSAHVPPPARGRALGLTELGWALSLALTVPVAGLLIERTDWRSPFLLVVAMAGAGALALLLTVPPDEPTPQPPSVVRGTIRQRPAGQRMPTGVAVGLAAALAVAAAESMVMIHGAWLTQDVGLSVSQLGQAALLIVVAELLGEGLVVAIADRIGLARTLAGAMLTSATMYAALGMVGNHVGLVLTTISAVFVAFEVTVVVLVALVSTAADDHGARAGLLGTLMAAIACGNAAGAAIGPLLFARGGMTLAGLASAAAAATAIAFLWHAGIGWRPHSARCGDDASGMSSPGGRIGTVFELWPDNSNVSARSLRSRFVRGQDRRRSPAYRRGGLVRVSGRQFTSVKPRLRVTYPVVLASGRQASRARVRVPSGARRTRGTPTRRSQIEADDSAGREGR